MRRFCVFCAAVVLTTASVLAADLSVSPSRVEISGAERVDGKLVGKEGALWAEPFCDGRNIGWSLFLESAKVSWQIDDFSFDPTVDVLGPQGAKWSGLIGGQPAEGTMRLWSVDPYSEVVLELRLLQGGEEVTLVVIKASLDWGAMQDTHPQPMAWPFKSYCACRNLEVHCASNTDCTAGTACPNTPGQVCQWHIVFDPWTIL